MSTEDKNYQMEIGRKTYLNDGYRVIGIDTGSHRPWMWYSPDLESAKLLAKTLCEEIDQDVQVLKLIGVSRRCAPPTEFIETQPVSSP